VLSEELISDSLKEVKLNITLERFKEINKILDYYSGSETDKYISTYFNPGTIKETAYANYNIFSRFIDKMSRIYQSGVKRTVNDEYSEMTRKKSIAMKQCEKMTNAVGTIGTIISLDNNNVFKYTNIYKFIPIFNDDVFNPDAIIYQSYLPISDITNNKNTSWSYVDKDNIVKYDHNGTKIKQYRHNLGVLPVSFTHRNPQIDSFFVEGANDIMSTNEYINVIMTDMRIGSRYQLWGQPWATGLDSEQTIIRMGADTVLGIPIDGKFDIAKPGGDINASIELVKFMVELCAQNNHLWITWAEQGGEVPSGISLMIKDIERHEDYIDDIELWREYERNIYDIEKTIAIKNNITLPEKIGLDFIEPKYPLSTNDQILWDNHRLQHNIITETELTLEYNPDLLNIKTAKSVWSKRKEINDKSNNQFYIQNTNTKTDKNPVK